MIHKINNNYLKNNEKPKIINLNCKLASSILTLFNENMFFETIS